MIKNHAIILSAGKGRRMNSEISKQYLEIKEKPILYYTLKAFEDSSIDDIVIVAALQDEAFIRKEILEKYGIKKVATIVEGGAERYDSVINGLETLPSEDNVLIHDGARPLIKVAHINEVIRQMQSIEACAVGMPVKDTIKVVDEQGCVVSTPDRRYVWQIQTPQAFRVGLIKEAYAHMRQHQDTTITDDAMAVEKYTNAVIRLIPADYENIKITTPEDLKYMETMLGEN